VSLYLEDLFFGDDPMFLARPALDGIDIRL
jgi:hypothetical protein